MEKSNPKFDRPEKLETSRINVTLDPDTVAAAKQLGNGNLSKGLRIAVKQSQQLERALKQISEYRSKPTRRTEFQQAKTNPIRWGKHKTVISAKKSAKCG